MKNSILDKGHNPCCSCGLCAVICPISSIEFKIDENGFFRPNVNEDRCKQCGLCKKVCYRYFQFTQNLPHFFQNKEIFGAWSKDKDVVNNSSSGGVGHELILYGLSMGYISCGVVFDMEKGRCKHILTESKELAERYCGSKYLQSYTVEAFAEFQSDKKYIVVGTPCQIYALRQYVRLKGWEDNFLFIDFFCHGTPSYLVWRKYIEFLNAHHGIGALKEVRFRSKDNNQWHPNEIKVEDISGNQYSKSAAFRNDLFYKFFLSNSCLNSSCPQCLLRHDHCFSDIRLADFWGAKYKNNENGVSLVTLNTLRGERFFAGIKERLLFESCTFSDLQDSQNHRFYSVHKNAAKVMRLLKTDMDLQRIYKKTIRLTLPRQIKGKLKNMLRNRNLIN